MDLGLGTLFELKANCLTAAFQTDTAYDTLLASLGKGVAAEFERVCNRQFGYAAGATFTCEGHKIAISLPRFPLVSVTVIEMRDTPQGAWVSLGTVDNVAVSIAEEAGLLDMGSPAGTYQQRLRITYTGGYFYETQEPTDIGYPTTAPASSTALPSDLKQAWFLQVQHVLEQSDAMNARASGDAKIAEAKLVLLPYVKDLLNPYRRFA